jgi:CAAX prenyl protease-like protein
MPDSQPTAFDFRAPAIARIVPFGVFIAFIALDGALTEVAPTLGMDPRWWYAIRVGIVAWLLMWYWRSYVELASARSVSAFQLALALLVGAVVFALWINLNFEPLAFEVTGGFDPRTGAGEIDWALVSTRLAGAALVVPVMEELFWRSFVMRWTQKQDFLGVDPKTVGVRALAISSGLFAIEHHLWFAGLLAGLMYGWLYIRTGNLRPVVLAHAVTNSMLGAWVIYTGSWSFW